MLTFLLAGNQFIFCRETSIAMCLLWNVAHWHFHGRSQFGFLTVKMQTKSLCMVLLKTLFDSIHFKLLLLILYPNILRYIKVSPFSGGLQVGFFFIRCKQKSKSILFLCVNLCTTSRKLGVNNTFVDIHLYVLHDTMITVEKEYSLNIANVRTKICLSLYYNESSSYWWGHWGKWASICLRSTISS